MNGEHNLSSRQRAFVAAVASGLSQSEAAQVVGCAASTGRRYMLSPAVRSALSEAQSATLGDVVRRMNAGATTALDVLTAVMGDADMPPAVRVRAALGWLDASFKARELLDLTARLDALEQRIEGQT